MGLLWKLVAIIHRLSDIVVHYLFKVSNFGKKEQLPPINNLLLLSSATSVATKIRKKKLKSIDLVNAYISRIKEVNPFLNAAVNERFDEALEEAALADELILSNLKTEEELERELPLLGVPISVKELISVKGLPFTAGLVSRKGVTAVHNARAVQLMRNAGCIPLVTTNVSELGMWYESYNKVYGRTSNAYDMSRTCGGSSGGEGALLSAAASVIGIGSDIGGSIRIPAFFNGIFGHKTTPGIISNTGMYPPSADKEFVPYLSTGPMCRFATDLSPVLEIMGERNASLLKLHLPVKMKELKIYYMEDMGNHVMFSKVSKDMISSIHKVLKHFETAYKIKPEKLKLPSMRFAYAMWAAAISSCKAPSFSSELAEHKSIINFNLELLQWLTGQSRFTFPAIVLGITEHFAIESNDDFQSMSKDLRRYLEGVLGDDGVLLFPSHPFCAPHHNEPLFNPFNFAYTGVFNVLGFPVTQCPLGLNSDGLPLGLQLVANAFHDRITLAVAVEVEKAFGGWVSPCPVTE